MNARCAAIAAALAPLGHPRVALAVTDVVVEPARTRIAMTLGYRRDQPVCCGEPGCYVAFLGARRREVPALVARALGREPNASVAVVVTVSLVHEPGFTYVDLRTGQALGPGVDAQIEYDARHFS